VQRRISILIKKEDRNETFPKRFYYFSKSCKPWRMFHIRFASHQQSLNSEILIRKHSRFCHSKLWLEIVTGTQTVTSK
jgi:hypothetical protein